MGILLLQHMSEPTTTSTAERPARARICQPLSVTQTANVRDTGTAVRLPGSGSDLAGDTVHDNPQLAALAVALLCRVPVVVVFGVRKYVRMAVSLQSRHKLPKLFGGLLPGRRARVHGVVPLQPGQEQGQGFEGHGRDGRIREEDRLACEDHGVRIRDFLVARIAGTREDCTMKEPDMRDQNREEEENGERKQSISRVYIRGLPRP